MRWSALLPIKSQKKESDFKTQNEELQKKELALDRKEKKLLKKEKELRNKIKQLNKHHIKLKSNAKADIKAATKLRNAKKKLLSALDAREKLEKSTSKKYKTVNGNGSDNWWKCRTKCKRKTKSGFRDDPGRYITNLLTRPCTCYCNPRHRKKWRRRRGDPEPSCLRKVFGGPCSCQPKPKKEPSIYERILGFQTCRCEYPSTRERHNFGGSGDCYLMTLRKTPQLWIYHRWPRLYPQYLGARHQWKNLSHCLLVCAAILFWMPCILCLELCKCCFCACFAE